MTTTERIEKTDEEIFDLSDEEQMEYLSELARVNFIRGLRDGTIHPRDYASVVSFLNLNNTKIEKKKELGMHERITELMKED